MKPNHKQNCRAPATIVSDHKQPRSWRVLLLPFVRYVNMRMLALLLFIGFALLNTTDGKDAQTKGPATEVNNTGVVTKDRHESSPVAPVILWQFTKRLIQAFTAAINDPSVMEYAKQQGTDTFDLQTTPCQGVQTKNSTINITPNL